MNNKENLIIITGPTAVGKTSLSLDLAQKINGEIISADSMQIYKYMNIGTDKIKEEEMNGIVHHMVDIIDPKEEFTVSDFRSRAIELISDINQRGKVPILVGGTGLYINSIIYDLNFTQVEPHYDIRAKYEKLANEKGREYIHSLLETLDKKSADNIHPNDKQRIIRALEICEVTGKKASNINSDFRRVNNVYNLLMIGLYRDREKLYGKINARVDEMIEEGLVDEVKSLYEKGYDENLTSMQAIGYKEIIEYLKGEASLDEAVIKLKRNSRRYAKRQLTWFRREDRIEWVDVENYDKSKLLDKIKALYP